MPSGGLQDTLDLDISTALAKVDQLDAALNTGASRFGSELNTAIGRAQGRVQITADTGAMRSEVERAAESTRPTVTLTVNNIDGTKKQITRELSDIDIKAALQIDGTPLTAAAREAQRLGRYIEEDDRATLELPKGWRLVDGQILLAGEHATHHGEIIQRTKKEYDLTGLSAKELADWTAKSADEAEVLEKKMSSTGNTGLSTFGKLRGELGNLANTALGNVSPALAGVASQAGGLASKFSLVEGAAIGVGVGVIATTALLAKFAFDGVKSLVALADEIRSVEVRSGATAEQASKLVAVGKALGVGADVIGTAFFRLSQNVNKHADVLAADGIQVAKNAKGQTDLIGTLDNVAEAYRKAGSGAAGNKVLMDAFGRSGASLIPILKEGKQGLDELYAAAAKHHEILTQQDIDRAKQYAVAQRELGEAVGGVQRELGVLLLPVLTTWTRDLTRGTELVDKAAHSTGFWKQAWDYLADGMKRVSSSYQIQRELEKDTSPQEKAVAATVRLTQTYKDVAPAIKLTAAETDKYQPRVLELAKAMGIDLANATTKQKQALQTATAALFQAITPTERLTAVQHTLADAVATSKEKVDAFSEALNALLDVHLAATQATIAVRTAMDDLNKTLKDGRQAGETAQQYQDKITLATISVTQAVEAEVAALVKSGDVSTDVGAQKDALISRLLAVADTYQGPVKKALQEYAWRAATMVQPKITPEFDSASTKRAFDDFQSNVTNRLATLTGPPGGITLFGDAVQQGTKTAVGNAYAGGVDTVAAWDKGLAHLTGSGGVELFGDVVDTGNKTATTKAYLGGYAVADAWQKGLAHITTSDGITLFGDVVEAGGKKAINNAEDSGMNAAAAFKKSAHVTAADGTVLFGDAVDAGGKKAVANAGPVGDKVAAAFKGAAHVTAADGTNLYGDAVQSGTAVATAKAASGGENVARRFKSSAYLNSADGTHLFGDAVQVGTTAAVGKATAGGTQTGVAFGHGLATAVTSDGIRLVGDVVQTGLERVAAASLKPGRDTADQYVSGLEQGLNAGTKRLLDAGFSAGSAVVKGTKQAHQTSSPSKVGIDIGGYFVEGITLGIKDKETLLYDAAFAQAHGLTDVYKQASQVTTTESLAIFSALDKVRDAQTKLNYIEHDRYATAEQLKRAQLELAAAEDEVNKATFDALDSTQALNDAMTEQTRKADELAAAHQRLRDSVDQSLSALGATRGLASAQSDLLAAQKALTDLQSEQAALPGQITAAQAALAAAQNASSAVTPEEQLAIVQARQQVTQAIANLALKQADATATADDLAEAELQVTVTQNSLNRAIQDSTAPTRDVTDAQQTLADLQARQKSIVDDLASAQRQLTDAQLGVVSAEESLIDAGSKLTGTQADVDAFFRSIATAAGLTKDQIDALIRSINAARSTATSAANGTQSASSPGSGSQLITVPGGGQVTQDFATWFAQQPKSVQDSLVSLGPGYNQAIHTPNISAGYNPAAGQYGNGVTATPGTDPALVASIVAGLSKTFSPTSKEVNVTVNPKTAVYDAKATAATVRIAELLS